MYLLLRLINILKVSFFMSKLFVTDLDGTLLNSNSAISNGNKVAIHEALKRDIIFTIATGRMFPAAAFYAEELHLDIPIITYNGAIIKSTTGKVYHEVYFPSQLVKELLQCCRRNSWYVQVYSDDKLYFPTYEVWSAQYEKDCQLKGKTVGWDSLLEKTTKVAKLLIVNENSEIRAQIFSTMRDKFGSSAVFASSKPHFIEVMLPTVSKANAINILAQKLQIAPDDVIAIGDSDNDISMLQSAKTSIAMGNAKEHIKKICSYTTRSNDEDGVAFALKNFVFPQTT